MSDEQAATPISVQLYSLRKQTASDFPAVLMRLDLGYAERQIAEMGGRVEFAATKRSLYPYFFSLDEETAIARRLRRVT